MATALASRPSVIRNEARQAARLACMSAELLRHLGSADRAEVLDQAQTYLRLALLEVEDALRLWRRRSPRRPHWIKRYKRKGGSVDLVQSHLRYCSEVEQALIELRATIRQGGDALAWSVLREDARVIAPLARVRTHHLTNGPGLAAVVQLIDDLHSDARLLALDNDLTRCLGSGDLTVVPSSTSWRLPLIVECKTTPPSEPLAVGTQVVINMSAPLATDDEHRALHDLFTQVIGGQIGTLDRVAWERDATQATEMLEDANSLLRSLVTRPELLASSRHSWQTMRNVLAKAMATGGAFDIAEPGVWFVSVRNRLGDDAESETSRLLTRLRDLGCDPTWPTVTTGDLAMRDRLAAIVPPIALWPQPRYLRVALLSGDLFLACIMSENLWVEAFRDETLELKSDSRGWAVAGGKDVIRFDPLERAKLLAGVAFGGVSPRGVARAVHQASTRI